MKATLRMDKAGRIVIPKAFRQHWELQPGSMFTAEIIGDRIELREEIPQPNIVRSKNGRRVIVGWDGFDAAVAVQEARERQIKRLEAPFQNSSPTK
jgi:AbrB family looped-hinge helix DNA binding protein